MMRTRRSVFGAAIALALLLGSYPARAASDAGSMDHAAMAKSYQDEATEDAAKAKTHEEMAERYKNLGIPKGSGVTKEQMMQHCEKLSAAYKQAAAQAGDLAKLHEKAASASK